MIETQFQSFLFYSQPLTGSKIHMTYSWQMSTEACDQTPGPQYWDTRPRLQRCDIAPLPGCHACLHPPGTLTRPNLDATWCICTAGTSWFYADLCGSVSLASLWGWGSVASYHWQLPLDDLDLNATQVGRYSESKDSKIIISLSESVLSLWISNSCR